MALPKINLHVPINNIHNSHPLDAGNIAFYRDERGVFSIEAKMGSYRCGMETNRQSMEELRDALTKILDAPTEEVEHEPA
jgi:hypothetical protein